MSVPMPVPNLFSFQAHLMRALAVLWLALLLPAMSGAAVPHDSAKPAYAEEQTILQTEREVPEPGWFSAQSGRRHFDRHFIVPFGNMPEQDVILQRGGNTWRLLRNGPLATLAGTLLLVVPVLIFGFYSAFGPQRSAYPETGRKIKRFTAWERLIHWATALTFIVLALSGIVLLFGKNIILPWLGHAAYFWVALASKYAHNFVGPLFILCSILMFITFVRRNLFRRWDWQWFKKGGGLTSHQHVPSGFFNAGEKFWFWGGVILLGLIMSITGLMMNFPYSGEVGASIGFSRYLLQIANYLHLVCAALYIAFAMGHIYIGTWGTPGAYESMRHGTVDESWARSHHSLWYEEVTGRRDVGESGDGGDAGPHGVQPQPRT